MSRAADSGAADVGVDVDGRSCTSELVVAGSRDALVFSISDGVVVVAAAADSFSAVDSSCSADSSS